MQHPWDEAPEWATYLTVNEGADNLWIWHEERPTRTNKTWTSAGRWEFAPSGSEVFEKRPVKVSRTKRLIDQMMYDTLKIVLSTIPIAAAFAIVMPVVFVVMYFGRMLLGDPRTW